MKRYPHRLEEDIDPLKLELLEFMSHLVWVLRTGLESSERVASAFTHLASLQPSCCVYNITLISVVNLRPFCSIFPRTCPVYPCCICYSCWPFIGCPNYQFYGNITVLALK